MKTVQLTFRIIIIITCNDSQMYTLVFVVVAVYSAVCVFYRDIVEGNTGMRRKPALPSNFRKCAHQKINL